MTRHEHEGTLSSQAIEPPLFRWRAHFSGVPDSLFRSPFSSPARLPGRPSAPPASAAKRSPRASSLFPVPVSLLSPFLPPPASLASSSSPPSENRRAPPPTEPVSSPLIAAASPPTTPRRASSPPTTSSASTRPFSNRAIDSFSPRIRVLQAGVRPPPLPCAHAVAPLPRSEDRAPEPASDGQKEGLAREQPRPRRRTGR